MIRDLHAIGCKLIEGPREEIQLYPTNAITVAPGTMIMNASAEKTRRLLVQHRVEVILIEYDEVHEYGGGIHYNTMQLIRDPGPRTFDADVEGGRTCELGPRRKKGATGRRRQ